MASIGEDTSYEEKRKKGHQKRSCAQGNECPPCQVSCHVHRCYVTQHRDIDYHIGMELRKNMADNALGMVSHQNRASQISKTLEGAYEPQGAVLQQKAHSDLYNLRAKHCKDVAEFVCLHNRYLYRFQSLGGTITTVNQVALILDGLQGRLPFLAKQTRANIFQAFDIQPDQLLAAAMDFERREEQDNQGKNTKSLSAKEGKKEEGKKKKKGSKTCTYCKKQGHTEDKCWEKHGYPEGKGPNRNSNQGKNNSQGTNSTTCMGHTDNLRTATSNSMPTTFTGGMSCSGRISPEDYLALEAFFNAGMARLAKKREEEQFALAINTQQELVDDISQLR